MPENNDNGGFAPDESEVLKGEVKSAEDVDGEGIVQGMGDNVGAVLETSAVAGKLDKFRPLISDPVLFEKLERIYEGFEGETADAFAAKLSAPFFQSIFADQAKTRHFLEGLESLVSPVKTLFILDIALYYSGDEFDRLFPLFIGLAKERGIDQLVELNKNYFSVLDSLYSGEGRMFHWVRLAAEMGRLGYHVSLFTDDVKDFIENFEETDAGGIADMLIAIAREVKKSPKIKLKRLIKNISHFGRKNTAMMPAIIKLVKAGVYPTERLVLYYMHLKSEEKKQDFEHLVAEKIRVMQETENVNPNDDLERELFYSYLGVSVDSGEFEEILKENAGRLIHFEHGHIKSFKIKANGVEVITENVDLQVVTALKERLANLAHDGTVLKELRELESKPKSVFTTVQKDALMDEVISVVTTFAKKMAEAVQEGSLFDRNSVFGKTEQLAKMNPGGNKLRLLQRVESALNKYVEEAGKSVVQEAIGYAGVIKTARPTKEALAAMADTALKAKKEAAICRQMMVETAEALLPQLDCGNLEMKDTDALVDYYFELVEFKGADKTKQEAAIVPKIRRSLYNYSLNLLEKERGLMNRTLSKVNALMYAFCLENPALKDKVADMLVAQVLREDVELAEVFSGRDFAAILEKAYLVFAEKLPALLEENLKAGAEAERNRSFAGRAVKLVNADTVLMVRNMMKQVKSFVFGGLDAAVKQSAGNREFEEAAEKLKSVLEKKFAEVEKYFDKPPSYIKRNFNPQNIGAISGSLKFHSAKNRTLEAMSRIEGLPESAVKILNGLRERMANAVEPFEECADLLSLLEKELGDMGADVTLAESGDFFRRTTDYLEAKKNGLNNHRQMQLHIVALEAQKKEEREKLKNRILSEYRAKCERERRDFDVAELNAISLEEVKKLEKEYGQKIKTLRREFESAHQSESRRAEMYDKMKSFLARGLELSDFESLLEKDFTGPIKEELSKITFVDTSEDELEVVISKKLGDSYKGFVSRDCSVGHGGEKHIFVKSFFNARIYKKVDAGRKWVGNGYILEAEVQGVPVLIIDALQLPDVDVNHRQFIKNFVDGIASSAQQSGYKYIISNAINSAYAGYLVSNSPKLREAYIKEYANAPLMTVGEGEINLENPDGLFFQAISKGDGRYRILWQAPDIELAHEMSEVEDMLRGRADTADLAILNKLYKTKKIFVESYLLTEEGFEFLKTVAVEGDAEKLKNYVLILNELIESKIRLTDFSRLNDIFAAFFEIFEADRELFELLIRRGNFDAGRLRDINGLLAWSAADPKKRVFVRSYIDAGFGQMEREWVENVYDVAGKFESALLGSVLHYLRVRKFEDGISGLGQFAEWLEASPKKYPAAAVREMMENGLLNVEGDYGEILDTLDLFAGQGSLRTNLTFIALVRHIRIMGTGNLEKIRVFLDDFIKNRERRGLSPVFLDCVIEYDRRFFYRELNLLPEIFDLLADAGKGQDEEKKERNLVRIVVGNLERLDLLKDILAETAGADEEVKGFVLQMLSEGGIKRAKYAVERKSLTRSEKYLLSVLKDSELDESTDLAEAYARKIFGSDYVDALAFLDGFEAGESGDYLFYDRGATELASLMDVSYLRSLDPEKMTVFIDKEVEEKIRQMKNTDEESRRQREGDDYDEDDYDADGEDGTENESESVNKIIEDIGALFERSGLIYRSKYHNY